MTTIRRISSLIAKPGVSVAPSSGTVAAGSPWTAAGSAVATTVTGP